MSIDATLTPEAAGAAELTPAAGPARARPPLRRRGPDPQRGARRAQRGEDLDELRQRIKRESVEAGLSGGLHDPEYGGQVVEDGVVPGRGAAALDQRARHMPALQRACERDRGAEGALPATGAAGELHDAYAVTEANAGSDPSRIETTARRTDGGWVINGEKWFVTYGDIAAVYIVVANALVDGERLSTLFLVDAGADGIEVVDDPLFTHTYPHGHPAIRFTDVEASTTRPLAGLATRQRVVHRGAAGDRRARRGLDVAAARGGDRVGAGARAGGSDLRLPGRVVPARRLRRRRRGRAPADDAGRAARGRGRDVKVIHGKASMAKLFVSEAAFRCADRAVQILADGATCARTSPSASCASCASTGSGRERAIQRLIVARALERRGRAHDPLAATRTSGPAPPPRSALGRSAPAARGRTAARRWSTCARSATRATCGRSTRAATASTGSTASPRSASSPASRTQSSSRWAASVPEQIADAGRLGCGGAVVYGAGFAEIEGGRSLQDELVEAARRHELPLCGPNGNGIVVFPRRVAIWGDALSAREHGDVAIVPERQPGRQRAVEPPRAALPHRRLVRQPGGAGGGRLPPPPCGRGRGALGGAQPRGTATGRVRRAGGVRRRRHRGRGAESGSSEAGASAAAAHTGAVAGDQRVFSAPRRARSRSPTPTTSSKWPRRRLAASVLSSARSASRSRGHRRDDRGPDPGACCRDLLRWRLERGRGRGRSPRAQLPPFSAETERRLAELVPRPRRSPTRSTTRR